MSKEDEEKTSSITEQGLYCYTVMLFRLKNVGATYHRSVNKMFKEQLRFTIEVYIDDMVVKSKNRKVTKAKTGKITFVTWQDPSTSIVIMG